MDGLPSRQVQHIIIIWYLAASHSGPFFFLSHLGNQVSHLASFRLESQFPVCWPLACYLSLPKSLIAFSSQALLTAFLLPKTFVFPLLLVTKQYPRSISTSSNRILQVYPVDVDTTRTKRSISLRNANLDEKKNTRLQLFAIAPPLNRLAALDSRRNRPPSIRPIFQL